jgi:hypothetical protein
MDWGTKKVRIGIAIVVFAAIGLAIPLYKSYRGKQFDSKAPTFEGDSTQLSQTVILPAFASPMVPGKNNIWCSTFQLAWNELKSTFKVPIVAKGAEDLSQLLNTAGQSKADLLENSYYAAAGSVQNGIIQKIQTDMARRFPGASVPSFNSADILIAFAYLEAYLKFREPFEEIERPLTFSDSTGKQSQVNAFGVWKSHGQTRDRMMRQVDLLFCTMDPKDKMTEFALDLCKFTQPYQVVVAMIDSKVTLQKTYETVQEKIRQFPDQQIESHFRRVQPGENLVVPELFWQINHHFSELIDKPFMGVDPISEAFQMIRFRLDRSGAVLQSEAKFAVKSAKDAPMRVFLLNKPFLIYLKKRDAQQPFFVMWVDNAELLSPK